MGVGGHCGAAGLFGPIGESRADLGQFLPQLINRRPRIKAQVGGDLLVAAAPTVQLVAEVADPRYELLLDEMMHILSIIVLHESFGRSSHLAYLLQAFQNADELVRRQHASISQTASVGPARGEFIIQQPPVEIKRPLPAFELRVQRLPEPPRPHLHRVTSTRPRARVRDGSPRMRMKPAASFWS